jgi:hypothetical protein
VDVGSLKRGHGIAGPIFSTLGVVYAVLLAFAIIVVWQSFDTTQNNVVREANYYADIYRDSVGLPENLFVPRSHRPWTHTLTP